MDRKTALVRSPKAQMTGSARGYLLLRLVDRVMPRGTPTIPDIIVTMPKNNETFLMSKGLSASSMVFMPFSMYLGPHQDRAPVQKVTQVKARVLNTKLLFLARLDRSSPYDDASNWL